MDYRTGKCSQCGAEYKIPASFAHNVARCKVCKGVVHLGPAQSGGGASADSAGAPAARREGARQRDEPRRERGAPRERRPDDAPAPRSVPADTNHMPERAPVAAEAARESGRDAVAPARPARRGEVEAAPTPRPAQHATVADGARRRNALLALVGAALVVALVVLLWSKRSGGSPAESEGAPAGADGGATSASPTATDGAPSAPPASGAREPAASEGAPKSSGATKGARDPRSIDLAAIPDLQPTTDTSATEWPLLVQWTAQWLDEDAGAAGSRAKGELVAKGRKAVPAILNAFKKQDFATRAGRASGDQCQKALMQICNGTNFDWRYADEGAGRGYDNPEDVWFCKHVAERWIRSWQKADEDIEAWIELARLAEKDPAEARRLRDMFGGQGARDAADPELGAKK